VLFPGLLALALLVAQGPDPGARAAPRGALALGAAREDPFEEELRVRALALEPERHRRELEAGLASPRWQERALALEALERRRAFGGAVDGSFGDAVEAALLDPHPDVVARALGVLAAMEGELSAELAEELAGERLPALRIALCEALRRVVCAVGDHVLILLALDPDERVREALVTTVAGVRPAPSGASSPERSWPKLTLLQTLLGLGRDEEALDLARGLFAAPLKASEWIAGEAPGAADPLLGGLLESLRYAHRESGDYGRWRLGFEAARGTGFERLFYEAARSQDEELAREWIQLLGERYASGVSDRSRFELVDALFLLVSPERLAALARELEVSVELWQELLGELGLRIERWDPELTAWLVDARRPLALRRASVRALATTLAREPESWRETARLLVEVLSAREEALRERALRALLDVPDPRPFQDELHASWSELPPETREALLERVPRDVALEAFLPEWIALGTGTGERRLASELLRPFLVDEAVSDELGARVRTVLEGWLETALVAFLEQDPPSREDELTLQALVHAMEEQAVLFLPSLDRVLGAVVGRSRDGTRAVFEALVRTPAGEERLAGYLEESADPCTRFEAALHLVLSSDAALARRAFGILSADHAACDPDQRRRSLRALRRYPTDEALEFLSGLVLSTRASPEERALALSTLGALDHPDRSSRLGLAVSSAGDFEARLYAARALGRSGDRAALGALRLALEQVRGAERLGDEERELLRTELLLSMGRTGHFPLEEESGLFDGPLARARDDMGARFRGEELAEVGFSWRSELHLAVHLAREGRLGPLLERTPGWIGMDGRLLIRLGLMLEGAGEAEALSRVTRRLLEAGLVASEGEAQPDRDERFEARSRLLGLAWRGERFADAGRLLGELLLDQRAGELPGQAFAEAFGVLDPPGGIDPRGRLESARLQALAYAALEAGREERARALARQARLVLGSSELALKEQERLESRL